MQATTYSITVNQVREAIARAGYIQTLELRSAIAARVIDGVRVVDCPMTDEGNVYDWTQTTDELRDGDVFVFASGTRAGVLIEAWPTVVAGDAEQLHTLAEGASWETLDGGKYAAAAAVARRLVEGEPEPAPAEVVNMATMARGEASDTPEERAFDRWFGKVRGIVGAGADEDLAFALYSDGCSPEEAAEEIRANEPKLAAGKVCDTTDESANTLRQQNEALRAALEALVKLHHDWDSGRASITVAFKKSNDAAIAAAREALRNSAAGKQDENNRPLSQDEALHRGN